MKEFLTESMTHLNYNSYYFKHEWVVSNWKLLTEATDKSIYSKYFLIDDTKWYLSLKYDPTDKYFYIRITTSEKNKVYKNAKVRITVDNSYGIKPLTFNYCDGALTNKLGYKQFVHLYDLDYSNAQMNIVCHVKLNILQQREQYYPLFDKKHLHVREMFKIYFIEEKHTDVSLVVEGKTIKAHKLILSVNSSVFRAMFSNRFIEGATNIVSVDNFNYEVMYDLIKFMYSIENTDFNNSIMELIVAADYYDMMFLKQICENVIISLLNSRNLEKFYSIVMVGLKSNSENINLAVENFFRRRWRDIKKTKSWICFKETEPGICLSLFDYI